MAWYDPRAGTRRRVSTGVGAGEGVDPPIEAKQALAAHYAAFARPEAAQAPAEAGLSAILTSYLSEHCAGLRYPEKDAIAVQHFELFMAEQRRAGALPALVTVADITPKVVDRFIHWLRQQGNVGETINRKLATIRGGINWAWKGGLITSAPYIKGVPESQCSGPRQLEWSPEQVAAILEAAWSMPERHHVHLFAITSLSTHARTNAILECDLDTQRHGKRIQWLVPGDRQTRKRRSTVPIAPSLNAWLEGRKGKLIKYRVPIAEKRWKVETVAEFFERPTFDIGNALSSTIISAAKAHPSLRLVEPLLDADGNQLHRVFTKRQNGRIPDPEPQWRAIGTPNTFRHTCHTYMQTMGVPQAQIDKASGHSTEQGSGANYTHLRPEYLREFIEAVETYWSNIDALTNSHRRSQFGPKIIHLPPRPAAAGQ
ncbi:integrase [Polymorphobacter multimanifer]|uniref:Integrase n=2 Tax=Polymorphobacter multimanifer TaxID=1070431 RepID=A0A841L6T9_9SPHN|nr:integrase [Polymorphobacter multimanifer]